MITSTSTSTDKIPETRENETLAPAAGHRGAGDPACPRCAGRGSIESDASGPYIITAPCPCARLVRLQAQIAACWPPGLPAETPAPRSVLVGKHGRELRIRADLPILRRHLARALVEAGSIFPCRIVSDLDLASTWLANAGRVEDEEVADRLAERSVEDHHTRIVDLVAPPQLLILLVGIKAAQLKDLPDLVLEAVRCRQQRGRATWIVDSATAPLRRGGCPAWSPQLEAELAAWPTVRLEAASSPGEEGVDLSAAPAAPAVRQPEPHPKVQAACADEQWQPDYYDDRGNAQGRCKKCGGPYSIFFGERLQRVVSKCKGTCGQPSPAASSAASSTPKAKRDPKAVLRDLLRVGHVDAAPVLRDDLVAKSGFALRSLEAAKAELRKEGCVIESVRSDAGRYAWVWRPS